MLLSKLLQKHLTRIALYVYRKPAKFYYDLENEIKYNLVKQSTGILHIGAHFGHKSSYYLQNGLKVIWIEALPEIFDKLQSEISRDREQIADCALLGYENITDTDFLFLTMTVYLLSVYD